MLVCKICGGTDINTLYVTRNGKLLYPFVGDWGPHYCETCEDECEVMTMTAEQQRDYERAMLLANEGVLWLEIERRCPDLPRQAVLAEVLRRSWTENTFEAHERAHAWLDIFQGHPELDPGYPFSEYP